MNMGVPHLKQLRDFMGEFPRSSFNRTELRDTLKHNFVTVKQNLAYLIDVEKVVIRLPGEPERYQWKSDTNE